MGWCGMSQWKDMPCIWKEIEKTKMGEDLHVTLSQQWAKHQGPFAMSSSPSR